MVQPAHTVAVIPWLHRREVAEHRLVGGKAPNC